MKEGMDEKQNNRVKYLRQVPVVLPPISAQDFSHNHRRVGHGVEALQQSKLLYLLLPLTSQHGHVASHVCQESKGPAMLEARLLQPVRALAGS